MRDITELAKDEIEELVKDYQRPSSEITVAQIIEKYDLNIKPNKIAASLPEQITDEKCPYCGVKMMAKIRNRNELDFPICKQCGHTIYFKRSRLWLRKECDCDNCQKVKEEEEKRKRETIKTVYGKEHVSFELEELTLKEKVKLIELVKKCPINSSCLFIGEYYDSEVRELYKKSIISVSPNSPIDAFSDNDFPSIFYPKKVLFERNVNGLTENNAEELLETEYKKSSAQERYELFLDVMHKDVLKRLEVMMNERGLGFEVLSNAEDCLRTLYSKISYSQIMSLCFSVARYYLDKTTTGIIYKRTAAKGAVKSVVTFYNNHIEKGWQIHNSEVNYAGKELKYYVTEIMKKDIRILREVITLADFE